MKIWYCEYHNKEEIHPKCTIDHEVHCIEDCKDEKGGVER